MAEAELPPGGALDGRVHTLSVRVYYEDTDFSGVVYHASHLRFFERGRTEFLRALGIGHRALMEGPDPCAFVVTRLAIDYRRAARIDDLLSVATRFERARGPRLHFAQRLLRGEEVIAEAAVDVACIGPSGAPRRPPAALAQQVAALLAPDED